MCIAHLGNTPFALARLSRTMPSAVSKVPTMIAKDAERWPHGLPSGTTAHDKCTSAAYGTLRWSCSTCSQTHGVKLIAMSSSGRTKHDWMEISSEDSLSL